MFLLRRSIPRLAATITTTTTTTTTTTATAASSSRRAVLAAAFSSSSSDGGAGDSNNNNKNDDDAEKEEASYTTLYQSQKEKDPFGFRELKTKFHNDNEGDNLEDNDEEIEGYLNQLKKKGKVSPLPRNVFGLDHITKERVEAWEAGVLPPQIYPPESDGVPFQGLDSPEDLYWPGNVETAMVEEGGHRVFAPQEKREIRETAIGGVCQGKKQRRGNQPLLCKKVDLEELVFTNVAVISQFLSPAGLIKPRRVSGLCAKCQRKMAKTVKAARHLGVIPHTSGVELYQRIKTAEVEDADAPFLSRKGGNIMGGGESGSSKELLKKVPSLTL